jgi:hypothetical protein
MSQRVPYLDNLRAGNFIPEFYDPDGQRYGLPTYPWKFAPDGLLTLRQLRAKGLRPGGHDICAQILWRHHRRRRVALPVPRSHQHAQTAGHRRPARGHREALQARRTCPACGTEKPYCIPRSRGECNDCADTRR